MKKSIFRKARKLTDKLLYSVDPDYLCEKIKIKPGYDLTIEVERITPENKSIYYGDIGEVIDLAFYVYHGGTEVDGISVSTPFGKKYPADLAYLLGMFE